MNTGEIFRDFVPLAFLARQFFLQLLSLLSSSAHLLIDNKEIGDCVTHSTGRSQQSANAQSVKTLDRWRASARNGCHTENWSGLICSVAERASAIRTAWRRGKPKVAGLEKRIRRRCHRKYSLRFCRPLPSAVQFSD